MKHTKSLFVAALAALSIGSAFADTTYIAGSSSFEATADAALTNFASTHFGGIVAKDATLGSETNLVLNWGPSSGNATNFIVVNWKGSEAGIQSIDAATNNPATIAFWGTNASGSNPGTTTNASAHIAIANTSILVSLFHGTPGADGRNYTTPLKDYQVAVEGLAFIASTNWVGVTNITLDQARSLYGVGYLPAAAISGIAADTNNTVFAVGRNADSGNRVSALAILGIGTKGSIVQFVVGSSNSVYQAPIATNDGYVNPAIGNDGYPSAGNVLSAVQTQLAVSTSLDNTFTTSGGTVASAHTPGTNYLIGYISTKKTAGVTSVTTLNFDGAAPTTANVENGTYTFWNYVHLMQSRVNTNADATTIVNGLKTILTGFTDSQLGYGNAAIANMQVQRTSDGGNLTATYIQ